MNKKINFKPYYNNDNFSYDELPQFILDTDESEYQKTTFTSKRLYFYMYNKDLSKTTKKMESENDTFYFNITNEEIQNYLNVSENTAKKYKKELIDAGLILEKSSKGKNPNRYAINKNLNLKQDRSTYVDKEGNRRFTYYKVPHFLKHSYFKNNEQCDVILYSIFRHRINLSINSAEKGNREFVDNNGKVFCRFTVNEVLQKLNLKDKNIIKDARNRLIANGLLKENTTFNSNKNTSSIKFYVYEPIALPVETEKQDENIKRVFIARTAKYANKVLLSTKQYMKKNALGINKNEATPQKNEANLSINNNDTPQKTTTRELELREPSFRELLIKHMKHMYKETSISDVQQSENVINLSSIETRTNNYPKALAAHINKYGDKYINVFCNVINKGKTHSNDKLNTNYTIEDVERNLINAVNSTGRLIKSNTKTQQEIERYLMGAVKIVFKQHHDRLNQPKESSNNEIANTNVEKRHQSREMTPQWLLERDKPKSPEKTEIEEDDTLEQDREAFLQRLKEQWGTEEEQYAN